MQPETQSARSRRSYGKIEDCEQSNQTALRSLFWAPKRLNELQEVRFEFPFQPDWQIDNGIFTCTTDTLKD